MDYNPQFIMIIIHHLELYDDAVIIHHLSSQSPLIPSLNFFKKCTDGWGREREREREREEHGLVVPLIDALTGCFLHVPWPGIGPATLAYWDKARTTELCGQGPLLNFYRLTWGG